jgi:ribosome-associated translation inhibitor RaiA
VLSTQVNFRHIPYSAQLTAEIERCVEHAQRLHPELDSCRIAIEPVTERRHPVKQFDVRIEYRLHSGKVTITHRHASEDPYSAVRQAFASGERALSSWLETHGAAA